MPKKRKFIDKKNSVTFNLVHRSQKDPLTADERAPKHVLVPLDKKHKELEKNEEHKEEERKFGIFFDDDYNYLQHLRDANKISVEWEPVERFRINKDDLPSSPSTEVKKLTLPSSVFASNVEEDVGLLNKAAPHSGPRLDYDPDVIAALDDDFDFDNPDNTLEDDFVAIANVSGSEEESEEGDQVGSEDGFGNASWDEELDEVGSLDGPCPFAEEETKSRFTEYSMSSSVIRRNDQLTLLDSRFEKMFESYDDTEIGALECEEIEGDLPMDAGILAQCADEFEHESARVALEEARRVAHGDEVSLKEEEDEEIVQIDIPFKNDSQWDCESILSTYSNIYNHPKLIQDGFGCKDSIKVSGKTGVPLGVLRDTRNSGLTSKGLAALEKSLAAEREVDDEVASVAASAISQLSIRPKGEMPEDRKQRKQAVRMYRKVQPQTNNIGCGVFPTAFSSSLSLNIDPSKEIYVSAMRDHSIHMFTNAVIEPFPRVCEIKQPSVREKSERDRARKRVGNMTDEKVEWLRARDRARKKLKRENVTTIPHETTEERERRLQKKREVMAKIRSRETKEQRETRLQKQKEGKAQRKLQETKEQREKRLQNDRERKAKRTQCTTSCQPVVSNIEEPLADNPQLNWEPLLGNPQVKLEPLPDNPQLNLEHLPNNPQLNWEPMPNNPQVKLEPLPDNPQLNWEPVLDNPKVKREPLPDNRQVKREPLPENSRVNGEPLPDNPQVSTTRLQKKREAMAKIRSRETKEQREIRLQKQKERKAQRKSQETKEQKEKRLQNDRERKAKTTRCTKLCQPVVSNIGEPLADNPQVKLEPLPDNPQLNWEHLLDNPQVKLEPLPENSRVNGEPLTDNPQINATRLQKKREAMAKIRSRETKEQRETRLQKQKERKAQRKSQETKEQREKRLQKDRERKAKTTRCTISRRSVVSNIGEPLADIPQVNLC